MSVANQETGQRVNFEEGLTRSSEEEILVYMKIGIFWENIRLTPSCHVEEMALDFVHRKFPNSGLNNSRILNLFIHQGWQLANFCPRPGSHFSKRIFPFYPFQQLVWFPLTRVCYRTEWFSRSSWKMNSSRILVAMTTTASDTSTLTGSINKLWSFEGLQV